MVSQLQVLSMLSSHVSAVCSQSHARLLHVDSCFSKLDPSSPSCSKSIWKIHLQHSSQRAYSIKKTLADVQAIEQPVGHNQQWLPGHPSCKAHWLQLNYSHTCMQPTRHRLHRRLGPSAIIRYQKTARDTSFQILVSLFLLGRARPGRSPSAATRQLGDMLSPRPWGHTTVRGYWHSSCHGQS